MSNNRWKMEDFTEKEQIFAFNCYGIKSSNKENENFTERGEIVFQVDPSDEHSPLVSVPPTWVPMRLNDFASTSDLLQSRDLRTLVSKGILVLAKEKDIKDKYLNDPMAMAEYDRLSKIYSSSMSMPIEPMDMDTMEAIVEKSNRIAVDPVIADIMIRSDLDEKSRLASLVARYKELDETFTIYDIDFIMVHSADKSAISKWVHSLKKVEE